ncbi:MAG: NAD(P)/FAD-dependent oxidoreductase [Variibacter sp.]
MISPLDDPSPLPRAYADDAPQVVQAGTLVGAAEADVAIVGGGFTGVSAAFHLAQGGLRPILLEARSIGAGAAGRNFGQVVPYTKHSEAQVLAHFGEERGQRLIAAAAAAPDLVFSLIESCAISCWAARKGLLFAAHTPAAESSLRTRAAFWQKHDAPVEMLGATATREHIGSDLYSAALFDRRGGTINPLAFVRGLANAAGRLGATFHEGTRVRSLDRAGAKWRLRTDEGTLEVKTVLLASDAYTDGFAPAIQRAMIPLRAYQVVSQPLSENVRRTILPYGQPLTDTRRLFSGVRLHPTGRLHVSLDGPPFQASGEPFYATAVRRVAKLYPHLGDLEWSESWSGWVGMTADHYPRLIKMGPDLLGALGFSGRGIALATLFGRELARHALGTPESDLVLPFMPPEPIRVKPFSRPLVGGLINLYRVLDGIDDRRLQRREQRNTHALEG